MNIKIDPGELGPLMFRHAAELGPAIRRGMALGAVRGKAHMVKRTPTNTGQMRNSWEFTSLMGSGDPVLWNTAPHVGIVEQGARPHPVSQEGLVAIAAWVRRKLITSSAVRGTAREYERKLANPRYRYGKGEGERFRRITERNAIRQRASGLAHQDADDEAMKIAHKIAWGIRQHGQKATWFVLKELAKLQGMAKIEVERSLRHLFESRRK